MTQPDYLLRVTWHSRGHHILRQERSGEQSDTAAVIHAYELSMTPFEGDTDAFVCSISVRRLQISDGSHDDGVMVYTCLNRHNEPACLDGLRPAYLRNAHDPDGLWAEPCYYYPHCGRSNGHPGPCANIVPELVGVREGVDYGNGRT